MDPQNFGKLRLGLEVFVMYRYEGERCTFHDPEAVVAYCFSDDCDEEVDSGEA